jgi:hypothetical protein
MSSDLSSSFEDGRPRCTRTVSLCNSNRSRVRPAASTNQRLRAEFLLQYEGTGGFRDREVATRNMASATTLIISPARAHVLVGERAHRQIG